jgi:2-hydroxychromene-2-carboxylate isomerase
MELEFYFDLGSPAAYLAHCRLKQLLAQYPALRVVYRPMLLGGVFKATGGASPVTVPAKGRYMLSHDLPRFAARYGVPIHFNPRFPLNTLGLMRGVLAARTLDCDAAYVDAVFDAMWVAALDVDDPAVLAGVLAGAGLDAAGIAAGSADPEIKTELIDATEEAVARGVFGAPTMFIGGEMFFGQDRFDFIEERLAS